ncbi:B-cell receptor CD22-like isoform X2 [Carassius auratus]|uniref:B-cell receptor CD22 n=1 Tax=Carassius auratus TaxID=7957 RepID=A0A6P6QX82_CARAU|nr:B-cell receptor CD22-like isoform X2 [Carassius auratus]
MSSKEVLVNVPERTETTYEGSSVTIPCSYKKPVDTNYTLLWFKDAIYLKYQTFDGTIVYSNTKERPQSLHYSSRVEYITDATPENKQGDWIKCDLRITDLQKTDSGKYTFRLISDTRFMSKALSLKVKDNPCKVHIEPSELKNPVRESDKLTVRCSTLGSCDLHPEWLVHTSGQKQEWTSTSSTDMIIETEEDKEGRKITKLKLSVTWKDDRRILSCRRAKSEDSFQIRNITLSVECDCPLHLVSSLDAPKEVKATVSSEDVKEGDSVTLSCTSRGQPDVSFSWYKKERIEKSQQMSDLKLNNVKPEDSGEYYCEAENKHGTQESNIIQIDVKYGPVGVKVQPVNIKDLKEGDELTLKCLVERGNPAVYQFMWYKNSQEQSETSETFIISKVTKEDRGSYRCQADNGIRTEISNNFTVSVKYSPRSIKIEGSTSVKVGTSLTLTCSADAEPQPHTYKWKHTPGLSPVPLSMETGQLNIEKVTIQHAGQYTCDITNTMGTGSHAVKVDVLYPPSNLSLIMQREAREFEVISIICTVQSNPVSHLTVTGPRGNLTYIQNNQRESTASAKKMTVYLNVTESDAGVYKCNAESQEGKQETKQKLIVFHAPKNVTVSVKGEQTFGSELTLTCEARADTAPSSYEWKKGFNGQLKTIEQKHEQRLHFLSLEISDSGQYACIAQNSIGKTLSPLVEMNVKYPPSNLSLIMQREAREFEVISIICTVQSNPVSHLTVTGPRGNLTYIQNNQGKSTASASNNVTVYLNVTESDAGVYKCNAESQEGKQETKQKLIVFHAPKNVTVSVKGEQTFGSELTLTCEARADTAPSSYEWKKDFNGQLKTIEQKHEQRLHFLSLEISDSGQYACIAQNSIGKTLSPLVEMNVKYVPIIKIVHNMTTLTQWNWEFPVSLTCSADAHPPAEVYNWYREEDNVTVLSEHQNFTVQPQNPGIYYCTAANAIGESRSENIMLFIGSNSPMVFYKIIFPIILLLILIVVVLFLIRRTIIKARSYQQSGTDNPLCFFPVFLSRSSTVTNLLLLGSRNDTQENLSVEGIPDSGYGRVNQSRPIPNSQDPTRPQDPDPRPKSNIHTVYAAIKLPQMKQRKQSPQQQKTGCMDNGTATSTLNYVTFDFKGQTEPEKRVPEGSAVYAMVSKNKQKMNFQSENPDYENVSSACVQNPPFPNMDGESDTSEEDEVNYSTVSCSAKSAVKEPRHKQKSSSSSSSSSDDEDRTEYSTIKT